jgi:hypothetical protein
MINSDKLLADQNSMFEEYLSAKRNQFSISRSLFLSWEKGKLTDFKTAILLWAFYRDFIFFPNDEEINAKMKALGFSLKMFKRTIAIEVIQQHFVLLEMNDIRVLKGFAIQLIDVYLTGKALNDIIDWYGVYDTHEGNAEKSRLYKMFHNHFKRAESNKRRYAGSYTLFDILLESEIKKIADYMGGIKPARAFVLKFIQGKGEKLLLSELLNCFLVHYEHLLFPYEVLSRQPLYSANRFLNTLYPLFKLILSDYTFMTEADIMGRDNSYHNYNSYVAQRIKRIIGL